MAMIENQAFLETLGWNGFFAQNWSQLPEPGLIPARVIGQEKNFYRVQFTRHAITHAQVTGKLWHDRATSTDLPAVGDWVACTVDPADQNTMILHILPRKTILQRLRPGTEPTIQVIATNIDYVFIATSLNEDFNIRRLDRYMKVVAESGATPILLLTKADLAKNKQETLESLKKEFTQAEIYFISKEDPASLEQLKDYFTPGKTSVLVGSSGVGKSTFVNFLVGSDLQKTQDVSNDSKGKHTTTSRNLLFTKWGGVIIDTPGMKEIGLVDEEADFQKDFFDIEEKMLQCKFSDCQHKTEPGCAITKALKDGSLDSERWQKYQERANTKGRQKTKAPGKKKY